MHEQNIYKQTAKMLLFIVASILLCRFTEGYFVPVLVFIGVICAFSSKLGWALVFFVLIPFFVILNSGVMPKASPVVGVSLRIGPLLIGLVLAILGASREGRHRLPFVGIIPFMLAALISSVDGWMPYVSYLKWINFVVFLFGIWFGTQNLQHRPADVFLLRSFFLAMAVVIVFGSILLIPFPSISYATSLMYVLRDGGEALAEEVFREMRLDGLKTLFCGITNHSQALGGLLVGLFPLVLCDMLFVERRFCALHVGLIVTMLPLIYMTRSRMALVSFVGSLLLVTFYTARRVQMSAMLRRKLGHGLAVGLTLLIIAAIGMQIQSGVMSHWVRKTDSTEVDRRSLGEALTSSRMGLMEYGLWEFRRSPLIGSGFQVAEYTRDRLEGQKGLIISASIEKGVLPVMVLGETGILGAVCFLFFLFSFYYTCSQRRYFVTITMFSILLVSNLGEATFFSPGGGGGIGWMICVVGGFTLDTLLLFRRSIEAQGAEMGIQMAAPAWEEVEDRSGRRRVVESERHVRRYGMKKGV